MDPLDSTTSMSTAFQGDAGNNSSASRVQEPDDHAWAQSLALPLCAGKGFPQALVVSFYGAQQGPRRTARLFGASLPFLHGSDAEVIDSGELDLRHAGSAPNGAHIDFRGHVGRGVRIGRDLPGNVR